MYSVIDSLDSYNSIDEQYNDEQHSLAEATNKNFKLFIKEHKNTLLKDLRAAYLEFIEHDDSTMLTYTIDRVKALYTTLMIDTYYSYRTLGAAHTQATHKAFSDDILNTYIKKNIFK